MDKLRAEPIGAEELERVKSYMRGDLAKTTDTPFSLSDYYCAAITNSIPDDYFHNQSAAVDSITPEMLQKMAAKYLDSGRMLTVVAGSLK
jgi:predicted Zn-dependent peptidase